MPVLKISTDSVQTYLGLFEAAVVSVIDYLAHVGPDGLNWKTPTFWGGIALAISRGVKGFFAAGVKAELETPAKSEPVQKVDVVVPQAEAKKEGGV